MSYVATKFRKHPLSFIPGGCTIIITHTSGESFIYDKIKYASAYIKAALKKNGPFITNIYLDNTLIWCSSDQQPAPRKLVPLAKRAV